MKITKEYRGLKRQRITYVFRPAYWRYEWNIEKHKCKFPFKNFMSRIWLAYCECKHKEES